MSFRNSSIGLGKQSLFEEQSNKVEEVKALLGPLPDKFSRYCSDACIRRYLTARSWNVRRATKMLKGTLKWRLENKPEEIRWEDIAHEAETGKIYRSNFVDKYGRIVLVMRPRGCQSTNSTQGQIRYLVYCMENAILNLPEDQEQMVWLIDFHGFTMSNISVKVTKETANVLQDHYPERLGAMILYNPPKIFESFWMVVKPFLEAKTNKKVQFVYKVDHNSQKIMEELFDMDELETAFGGKNHTSFNYTDYAAKMMEDDKRMPLVWAGGDAAQPLPVSSLNIDIGSDSDESVKEDPDTALKR
ncbi:uncharacterized protein A4U43_C08F22110 [Asparagus officinalis]|uniref:random slug protein 5-like n=1 Tax=Asparagus officinalis TaxID=4686 RepID=UPI00098E4332|nr:random slug protein 5-like [Asparagus officinalis]ONK60745.1 uncharacterized protein A4U43_C08F22110 [Asparagus officinalis]